MNCKSKKEHLFDAAVHGIIVSVDNINELKWKLKFRFCSKCSGADAGPHRHTQRLVRQINILPPYGETCPAVFLYAKGMSWNATTLIVVRQNAVALTASIFWKWTGNICNVELCLLIYDSCRYCCNNNFRNFIKGINMRHYCNRGNIDIEFHVL